MSKDSVYAYTHVGTPYYMSPEQITDGRYTEKSDIWSTGCILYEMATLSPPFEASNHVALAMKIKDGRFARLPSRYSEELNRVISWMITTDYRRRPSTEDLLKLPLLHEEPVISPRIPPVEYKAPLVSQVANTKRPQVQAPTNST
jgi:serine/threonine protein kinase